MHIQHTKCARNSFGHTHFRYVNLAFLLYHYEKKGRNQYQVKRSQGIVGSHVSMLSLLKSLL